jgi:hypothetical protein
MGVSPTLIAAENGEKMGVAYYPSFEHETPGYDPSLEIGGKSLARAMDDLGKICKQLGERDLMSFYSESVEEAFGHIGEPVPAHMAEQPIEWSEPTEGLRTIGALIIYLTSHPTELTDTQRILVDLRSFQAILNKAVEYKTRFRLRIDV